MIGDALAGTLDVNVTLSPGSPSTAAPQFLEHGSEGFSALMNLAVPSGAAEIFPAFGEFVSPLEQDLAKPIAQDTAESVFQSQSKASGTTLAASAAQVAGASSRAAVDSHLHLADFSTAESGDAKMPAPVLPQAAVPVTAKAHADGFQATVAKHGKVLGGARVPTFVDSAIRSRVGEKGKAAANATPFVHPAVGSKGVANREAVAEKRNTSRDLSTTAPIVPVIAASHVASGFMPPSPLVSESINTTIDSQDTPDKSSESVLDLGSISAPLHVSGNSRTHMFPAQNRLNSASTGEAEQAGQSQNVSADARQAQHGSTGAPSEPAANNDSKTVAAFEGVSPKAASSSESQPVSDLKTLEVAASTWQLQQMSGTSLAEASASASNLEMMARPVMAEVAAGGRGAEVPVQAPDAKAASAQSAEAAQVAASSQIVELLANAQSAASFAHAASPQAHAVSRTAATSRSEMTSSSGKHAASNPQETLHSTVARAQVSELRQFGAEISSTSMPKMPQAGKTSPDLSSAPVASAAKPSASEKGHSVAKSAHNSDAAPANAKSAANPEPMRDNAPVSVKAQAGGQDASVPAAGGIQITGLKAVAGAPKDRSLVPNHPVDLDKVEDSSLSRAENDVTSAVGNVQVARLIQHLSESELRVGIHAGEFGKVDIHTLVNQSQISARIYVEHDDLGKVLAGNLPQLHEKLSVEHRMDAQIELLNSGLSYSTSADRQQHQQQNHPAEQKLAALEDASPSIPRRESVPESHGITSTGGVDMHI